ncbi:helicase [Agrobacterium tumefaciens]|uniref:Helicase n=1 Tax=Agrobacterium tumefaciens TaxID=358 RepID=A0A0D0KZM5_AGRTU|nr:helicase [Agrobacterium tumefaciens]
MSHDLSLAQSHAFQLSRDLMVPVTAFAVDGEYGVLPSDEIDDGDDLEIVHEFFPWAAH